jgi:hypothetical protein
MGVMKQVVGIVGAIVGVGLTILIIWGLMQGLGPLLRWATARGIGATIALLALVPLLVVLTVRMKKPDD